MPKFVSEWFKTEKDFTFPEGMPEKLQQKVINRRRQIMVHAYLMFGLQEECISNKMWTHICKELEELQAVWGYEFNFYDWMFDEWRQEQEDHLLTNKGIDNGVLNHALAILQVRKKAMQNIKGLMNNHSNV